MITDVVLCFDKSKVGWIIIVLPLSGLTVHSSRAREWFVPVAGDLCLCGLPDKRMSAGIEPQSGPIGPEIIKLLKFLSARLAGYLGSLTRVSGHRGPSSPIGPTAACASSPLLPGRFKAPGVSCLILRRYDYYQGYY